MIVDGTRYRTGTLDKIDRTAGLQAAAWRTDDPWLAAAYRAVVEAVRREMDRRAARRGPGPILVDLPILVDADPSIAATGLRLFTVGCAKLAEYAATDEERAFWGDLAGSAANLEAERRHEQQAADDLAFGATVVARELP